MKTIKLIFGKSYSAQLILIFSAILAVIMGTLPVTSEYIILFKTTPISITIGNLNVYLPLHLWINNGLMVLFYLLIGLRIKREFYSGILTDRHNLILSAGGTIGGVIYGTLFFSILMSMTQPLLKA